MKLRRTKWCRFWATLWSIDDWP